jgi:putative hydrolase of the HAD superfamily
MSVNVEWLLFDFGGCLDSDGVHSRTLFFKEFVNANLLSLEEIEIFQDAYSYSDQRIVRESLIITSSLQEMNEKICSLIALHMDLKQDKNIIDVAKNITDTQSSFLKRNREVLTALSSNYKLGMISNFSGNLDVILKEFSLYQYFDFVIDSYHAKVTKPDHAIFKMAIDQCGTSAERLCFIGDNIERDILPAHSMGLKTILINPLASDSMADYTISSLTVLPAVLHSI